MTDPLNACLGEKSNIDLPDSPYSVGWTRPRRALLADKENPLPLECGLTLAPVNVEYEMLLVSYSTDWLYPPEATRAIARAIIANGRPVSYINIPSAYGHDAFLLETDKTAPLINFFLKKGNC